MKKSITNFLNRNISFLSWLFLILIVEYLFLFSLEMIFKGFVMSVFNLNFLLLFIIILWTVISFKEYDNINFAKSNFLLRLFFVVLLPLIAISLFFVLYKAKYWEITGYCFFVFLTGELLFEYFEEMFFEE